MTKRKMAYAVSALAVVMGAGAVIPSVHAEDPVSVCPEVDESKVVATFDGCKYEGLDPIFAAINNDAKSGVGHTVTLEADTTAGGYSMKEGVNFVLDLNGKTLQMGSNLVGSTGTKSQNWQLLKNSDIEFKNGTLRASTNAKMLIQNYSNLTLRDVEIDATPSAASYALSNNNGLTQIVGSTSIKAPNGKIAFDACWAPNKGYPNGAQVVVDTTGVIDGIVQVDLWGTMQSAGDVLTSLTIKNGTFTKPFDIDERLASAVVIEGGSFATEPVESEIVDGMEAEQSENTGAWEILPKQIDMTENGAMPSDGTKTGAIAGDAVFNQGFVTDRKAYFELSTLDDNEFGALTLDATKGGDLLMGFDASLWSERDGLHQISGVEGTSITVRVALTEEQYNVLSKYDSVAVAFFNEQGVETERLPAELVVESDNSTGNTNYYLVFTTTHLSTYGVVGVNATAAAAEGAITEAASATTPDTGTITRESGSAMVASILTAVAVGILTSVVSFAVLIRRK